MDNTQNALQLAINGKQETVSIYQVPTGVNCGCFCPECGEPLEAKNKGKTEGQTLLPNQKIAHFAHISGKLCKYATETALHRMAKTVLSEHKKLMLPRYVWAGVQLFEGQLFEFDSAIEEKEIKRNGKIIIIPDVTLIKGKTQLLIEFYKSHKVDAEKYDKIKELGISTIEVDLNGIEPLKHGQPNFEGLKEFLVSNLISAKWIFNSQRDKLRQKKIEQDKITREIMDKELQKKMAEEKEREKLIQALAEEKNKAIEKWKKDTIEKGFKSLKVYESWWEKDGRHPYKAGAVYCPKEPKNNNKIQLYTCENCLHHYKMHYSREYSFVFCGFKIGYRNTVRRDLQNKLKD